MNAKPWWKKTWIKVISLFTFLAMIGGFIVDWTEIYSWIHPTKIPDIQLTVFVTDEKGNVVLENEGELNIPLGNRSMNKPIGLNGRTNFPDITKKYLGDSITIGLKAEEWILVNEKNKFEFDGKPIYLKVKKDYNLGLIFGIVKSLDGQTLINNAKILINNDETTITDSLGRFKKVLPKHLRVNSWQAPYNITVVKDDYKKSSFYCYPNKACEIRLEKYNP